MFAKVKSSVFIDTLKVQVEALPHSILKAVLRDEEGLICRSLEKTFSRNLDELAWEDLNHLPYGVYTLELSQGEDQLKLRLVKRV